MKWLVAVAIGLLLAGFPSLALADDGKDGNDVLVRVRGDVRIAPGERVGSVVVINGDAIIEGQVDKSVTVIRGNAVISGTVGGNLTVISGDIDLGGASHVNNVFSIRGSLVRTQGATVTGQIRERDDFRFLGAVGAIFSILFWLAMTVAVLVAALVFAAVGGRQLTRAARAMTEDAVNVIVGVVFVWVAIPALAVAAMLTLIGIPLGAGLFVFLLPALWFLGYIVAGARLGGALVGLMGRTTGEHPFAAAALGVILLQLALLIPFLGAIVGLFAGVWGAGAIAFSAYRAAGGKGLMPTHNVTSAQPQPVA